MYYITSLGTQRFPEEKKEKGKKESKRERVTTKERDG